MTSIPVSCSWKWPPWGSLFLAIRQDNDAAWATLAQTNPLNGTHLRNNGRATLRYLFLMLKDWEVRFATETVRTTSHLVPKTSVYIIGTRMTWTYFTVMSSGMMTGTWCVLFVASSHVNITLEYWKYCREMVKLTQCVFQPNTLPIWLSSKKHTNDTCWKMIVP